MNNTQQSQCLELLKEAVSTLNAIKWAVLNMDNVRVQEKTAEVFKKSCRFLQEVTGEDWSEQTLEEAHLKHYKCDICDEPHKILIPFINYALCPQCKATHIDKVLMSVVTAYRNAKEIQ